MNLINLRTVAYAALLSTAVVALLGGAASGESAAGWIASQSPDFSPTPQAFAAIIDQHYNSLRSLSVEFTQFYNGMGILDRTESGTLLLRRPGRLASAGQMRWTYSKPAGKLFVLDGHDAYFYTPGQNEVQRVPAKRLDDLRSPLAFLLGRTSLARELDGLKIVRGGMLPGPTSLELTGVPHGMEKRIALVAIGAKDDGTITMLRIEETDGAINNFTLKNEQPNVPVSAKAFTFTPPPGTHVVEGMPPL